MKRDWCREREVEQKAREQALRKKAIFHIPLNGGSVCADPHLQTDVGGGRRVCVGEHADTCIRLFVEHGAGELTFVGYRTEAVEIVRPQKKRLLDLNPFDSDGDDFSEKRSRHD